MPVFNIHHVTKYEYDRPVKESVNQIRIYPFASAEQEVLFHELNVISASHVLVPWKSRVLQSMLGSTVRGRKARVIALPIVVVFEAEDLEFSFSSGDAIIK